MSDSLLQQLPAFLVKAKINTYATNGEGGESLLKDGTKELTFTLGGFRYRDRYLGFNPFIGQEIIWHDDMHIWGMNYYGRLHSELISTEELYTFLKKSLLKVEERAPFRGPDRFAENGMEYRNKYEGDIEAFQGVETILLDKKPVFTLLYHGGSVA